MSTAMENLEPRQGRTFVLRPAAVDPSGEVFVGAEFRVEGLWNELTGESWMASNGNPAALKYAMRSAFGDLPLDDDVWYGKIGPFGHLVHESEIGDEVR